MKGVYPEAELAELEKNTGITASKTEALKVPGLAAQRHLVFLPFKNIDRH